MINIQIDNLMAFYIIMALMFVGGAILVVFGTTEDREAKRRNKRTTTS
jgi:hypothetical protein